MTLRPSLQWAYGGLVERKHKLVWAGNKVCRQGGGVRHGAPAGAAAGHHVAVDKVSPVDLGAGAVGRIGRANLQGARGVAAQGLAESECRRLVRGRRRRFLVAVAFFRLSCRPRFRVAPPGANSVSSNARPEWRTQKTDQDRIIATGAVARGDRRRPVHHGFWPSRKQTHLRQEMPCLADQIGGTNRLEAAIGVLEQGCAMRRCRSKPRFAPSPTFG